MLYQHIWLFNGLWQITHIFHGIFVNLCNHGYKIFYSVYKEDEGQMNHNE
jgi:hypothetical protein